jgi:alkylation response protein AidB-like acyl-CoA dehydrogenase
MTEKRVFVGGEFLIADAGFEDAFIPEDFNEEQEMVRDATREFVKKEVVPVIAQLETKDFKLMRELHEKAGELDLLSSDIPDDFDGMGLDKVSTTIIADELGIAGPFGVHHGAHTGIGTLPIVYFGNEEQKQKYLPKLASGEWVAAYCLTETGAGSDALSGKTKAVLTEDGKHYILNGSKQFITNAGYADLFIVYAKVDGEKFSGFIVERGFEGVTVGPEEGKMGGHGNSTCPVILEDVKVPVENLLYEVGKGHKIAFNILNLGRWKLGSGCVGGCKGWVANAAAYANERKQFGKPISSFGMIKKKLASMAIKAYMAESVMYRLAGMFDDKLATLDEEAKKRGTDNAKAIEEYATECSIAKVFGSETLDFCVDEYVQILGGYGYSADYPAERCYRDARINRIWEGTNEINRMLIPGTLMKRALQGRLDLLGAAKAVAKELMSYSPLSVKLGDEPLALQAHMVRMCKKLALMTSGVAAQKLGEKLIEEQEVLEILADIIMEIFAMESGLLRANKLIAAGGEAAAALNIAAVKVYVDETVPKIEALAKQMVAYVEDGDMLRTQLAAIKKMARYQPLDAVTLRRAIADKVIEREGYPF